MNKELLQQYAEVKNKIKELTEVASLLSLDVISELNKDEIKTVKSDFGTFSIVERKNWKYSEVVDTLKKQLDTKKKEEEQKGVATFENVISLNYRNNDNENNS